jgi:hypothetical protein
MLQGISNPPYLDFKSFFFLSLTTKKTQKCFQNQRSKNSWIFKTLFSLSLSVDIDPENNFSESDITRATWLFFVP